MKNMTLKQLKRVCEGKLYEPENQESLIEQEAAGIVIDSRKVESGMFFIATRGEKVDGHDFIQTAVEKGAIGIVGEKVPEHIRVPYLLVEDSFLALKEIAEFYRNQLSLTVIGITGSVGKTSTKEFVAGVLSVKYQVAKTQGNFNNEIGLPLTVLQIKEEHDIAVLEMGISDFGEMHRLAKIARPDICILTNIGTSHLETLGDRAGVLKAKSEIFDYLKEDGRICINGDDPFLSQLTEIKGITPLRFGLSKKNDVYAGRVESRGLLGSTARINMGEQSFGIKIPLPGAHMVYNALAAACAGSLMGLTAQEIAKGISKIKPVSGRSNVIIGEKYTVIDDCYNANPVSMKAAIDLLIMAETRKVAVLGDMFELGINEQNEHFGVGAYAVEKNVDVLVCIGTLSEKMYEGACKTGDNRIQEKSASSVGIKQALTALGDKMANKRGNNLSELQAASDKKISGNEIFYFTDKESFLEKKDELLKDKDTILLKASHGMHFEKLREAIGS